MNILEESRRQRSEVDLVWRHTYSSRWSVIVRRSKIFRHNFGILWWDYDVSNFVWISTR